MCVDHYHGFQGIETEGHRLGLGQDAVGLTMILDRGQFPSSEDTSKVNYCSIIVSISLNMFTVLLYIMYL